MMRYGIPAYRLPRDVLDLEIARIVGDGRHARAGRAGDRPRRGDADRWLRRGVPGHRRAIVQAGLHPRRRFGARPRRARRAAGRGRRRDSRPGPPRSRLRGRQHRHGRGPHRPPPRSHRHAGRVPAHPGAGCPPTRSRSTRPSRRACACAGSPRSRTPTAATVRVERMRLDEKGFPQPTGEFDELAADSVVLAIGQDVDRSLLDGIELADGGVRVDAAMMSSQPGVFAGGDAVADERTVTAAVGHGKRAARHIDALLRGVDHRDARTATSWPRPTGCTRGTTRTRRPRSGPGWRRPGGLHIRRGGAWPRRGHRPVRGPTVPVVRELLRVRQLLRHVPRQRGHQARARLAIQIDLDYCKGCGICAAECPCGAITMVPEQS